MTGFRKSTDAGLSNAERKTKTLRESEAQEAMLDHTTPPNRPSTKTGNA
jgi:hypothetical protein